MRSEKSNGLRNYKSRWCSWATCARYTKSDRQKSTRI